MAAQELNAGCRVCPRLQGNYRPGSRQARQGFRLLRQCSSVPLLPAEQVHAGGCNKPPQEASAWIEPGISKRPTASAVAQTHSSCPLTAETTQNPHRLFSDVVLLLNACLEFSFCHSSRSNRLSHFFSTTIDPNSCRESRELKFKTQIETVRLVGALPGSAARPGRHPAVCRQSDWGRTP